MSGEGLRVSPELGVFFFLSEQTAEHEPEGINPELVTGCTVLISVHSLLSQPYCQMKYSSGAALHQKKWNLLGILK